MSTSTAEPGTGAQPQADTGSPTIAEPPPTVESLAASQSWALEVSAALTAIVVEIESSVVAEPPPATGSAADALMAVETKPLRSCVVCTTDFDHDSISLINPCKYCDSPYCEECLQDMFRKATTDQTRMPPRCCQFLQLHTAIKGLSDEEATSYRQKFEEWITPGGERIYCPVPSCSTFVAPRYILATSSMTSGVEGGSDAQTTVTCPKCATVVCLACKSVGHPGADCSTDVADAEKAMLARFGYKPCPRCSQAIKRMYGCDHMLCICGHHFCWGCLEPINECGGCGAEDDDDEDERGSEDNDDEAEIEEEGPAGEDIENGTGTKPADPQAAVIEVASADEEPKPAASLDTSRLDSGYQSTVDGLESPHLRGSNPVIGTGETLNLPTRPRRVNLDAGGAEAWDGGEYDFGQEPREQEHPAIWECSHGFHAYQAPEDDGYRHGNFDRMECNRCFTAVKLESIAPYSTQVSPAETMEKEITAGNDDVDDEGEAREEEKADITSKMQAWECDECALIVCEDCRDLV